MSVGESKCCASVVCGVMSPHLLLLLVATGHHSEGQELGDGGEETREVLR